MMQNVNPLLQKKNICVSLCQAHCTYELFDLQYILIIRNNEKEKI